MLKANGASEIETSADPEKVIIEYQCDGYIPLTISVRAMSDMPRAESQRR